MLHADHDLVHRRTRIAYQTRAQCYLVNAGSNQVFDFPCRLGAAPGQAADFARHHGETSALLPGSRSLHRRIERQDIGLKRNAIDDGDDVGNLHGADLNLFHRGDHRRHLHAATVCDVSRGHRQQVGACRRLAGQLERRAQFFH